MSSGYNFPPVTPPAASVPPSRKVATDGTTLTGGGDLSADRMLSVAAGVYQPAGSYAPLPTSSAGAGQFISVVSANGGVTALSAGGTWLYGAIGQALTATGVMNLFSADWYYGYVNIKAGGTSVVAGRASYTGIIWEWEIQDSSPIDFTQPIFLMPDGSYVVMKLPNAQGNVYPYNVLPTDAQWPAIQAWLAAGNVAQLYVPPKAQPMDPEIQLVSEIMADYIDAQKATKKWQTRLAALKTSVAILAGR